jgi:hypothetical protein
MMYQLDVVLYENDIHAATARRALPNGYFPQPPAVGDTYLIGPRPAPEQMYASIKIDHVGATHIGPMERDDQLGRDPEREALIWIIARPNGPGVERRSELSTLTDFQRQPFREQFLTALERSGFAFVWHNGLSR